MGLQLILDLLFLTQASIVHITNSIWMSCNHVRFHNRTTHWKMALNQILVEVAFIGNITTKMVSSSIHEFTIFKSFKLKLHPPKAMRIIEVIWRHLADGWLKCNTSGSFSTDLASCGSLFRNSLSDFVFGFADKFDYFFSIHAELFGIIKTINFASNFGWNSIWLETDTFFVLLTIQHPKVIP